MMKITLKKSIIAFFALILVICVIIAGKSARADEMTTVTATINYYYYDQTADNHKGERPYPAFIANMPINSVSITEKSPSVPGYKPMDINNENDYSVVTVNFDKDSTIDVFYYPAEVPYVINLYTQELDDSTNYIVADTIYGQGETGTVPEEFKDNSLEKQYEGFTLMYYVPDTIAADGSTVFECYYDRNYYLVDVSLGGGYGVESVYKKYGSSFSLGTPTKAGFDFAGWEITNEDTGEVIENIPSTIPSYNLKFTAIWEEADPVAYRIIYKNADVHENNSATTYSFWGRRILYESPEKDLTIDEIIAVNKDEISEFTDYEYFEFDEKTTKQNNPDTITIAGDGSTLVTLYYSRKSYTIRYVYARQAITAGTKEYESITDMSELISGHEYVIASNKNTSVALTASKYNNNFLALSSWSDESYISWTIEELSDGTYTLKNGDKYLKIANGTSSLSDTPISTVIACENGVFSIKQGSYYLNNWGGDNTKAGGYNQLDNGSKWIFYDATEEIKYTESPGNIYVPSRTGNGDYYYTKNDDVSMIWTQVESIPTVNNSNDIYEVGSYIDDNKQYRLYYISITAEYKANIEDIWPSSVIGSVSSGTETYSFGSWGAEAGSPYRTKYGDSQSDHANIVGPYPILSSDMIIDPENEIAQTMFAWYGRNSRANISTHKYNIYYEVLPGETGDIIIDGVEYKLDRTLEFTAAHNGSTRVDPFEYYGFTIIDSEKDGYSNSIGTGSYQDENGVWTTDFHYRRNVHILKYFNYNGSYINPDISESTIEIVYGQSISDYEVSEPDYPAELQADKYYFDGWYDSDIYDTEFNWNITMPDNDLVAYAYWKPKTFTVRFYNDKSAYNNGEDCIYSVDVEYNDLVDSLGAENSLTSPTFESGDGGEYAKKAGWFYYDESGNLHAFNPGSMKIVDNMDLFMEWTTTVPAYYTVYYVDEDGNNLAAPTKGYSFVGRTKTFKSKSGSELYEEYQQNYYADKESTSILMKVDPNENVVVFTYIYKDKMPYTVRYIDIDTGNSLLSDKIVSDNINSIVTERYIPISKYNPTSYYVTLTLTADEDSNIITFYYKADEQNTIYHVKYLLEDENGEYECAYGDLKEEYLFDGEKLLFTQKHYIDGVGAFGSIEDIIINKYDGYTAYCYQERDYSLEAEISRSEPVIIETGISNISLELDDKVDSKEIRIYYVKNKYKAKINYEIDSDDSEKIAAWNDMIKSSVENVNLIADRTTEIKYDGKTYYKKYYQIVENLKYKTTYTSTAPNLDGYRVDGSGEKSIVIYKDDDEFSKNNITFTYTAVKNVMIYYEAVLPKDSPFMGISDDDDDEVEVLISENQTSVEVGVRPRSVEASLTTLDKLYKFVGWYYDEDCTKPVQNSGDFTEDDAIIQGDDSNILYSLGVNQDTTYYAKYDYIRGNLIIETKFEDDAYKDSSQVFEFIIRGYNNHNSWIEIKVCIEGEGTKTIADLPIGNYTVEQTNWSWRYKVATQNVEVQESETIDVTFNQKMTNTKWLDGNMIKDNKFANSNN